MATKQFAIPLDSQSIQSGEIKFTTIEAADLPAEFSLTNVTDGGTNELNLVTRRLGNRTDHVFMVGVKNGTGYVTLSHANLATIKSDALNGDWDYVEATWTVGQVNTPANSSMYITQSATPYNLFGWPPKT